jgi:hypothetical protein
VRILYWFIGAGFIVLAFICFVVSVTIWNTARTDPEYPRKPKHVAAWACGGLASLALMVLFYSL